MKHQTISNKMRQILLTFFCLILLSSKTFSQQNLQLTRLNNSCDTLIVKTWVWFPFGSQSACPQLSYFETVGNSDTMELKLFYDVRGAWPQVGCGETDTITSVALPDMTVLKGVAYSINYDDTIAESTTQLQICGPTAIKSIDNDSFFMIFPSPFSTQLNFQLADNWQTTVILYDFLGRQILQQTFTNSTTINTEQFSNGIYFYKLRSSKGTIAYGKVIKH